MSGAEDGGDSGSSCMHAVREKNPFLGSVLLRGVPTQCRVNNTGSILLSCDVFCRQRRREAEENVMC